MGTECDFSRVLNVLRDAELGKRSQRQIRTMVEFLGLCPSPSPPSCFPCRHRNAMPRWAAAFRTDHGGFLSRSQGALFQFGCLMWCQMCFFKGTEWFQFGY